MKHSYKQQGFLVLEILIAGLILTASIASAMYLFRMGYSYLDKANQSNVLSAKLVQAAGLLKYLELEKKSGMEDMGDGVKLSWDARLLESSRPIIGDAEFSQPSLHELYLYRINFNLEYKSIIRSYEFNLFRYKPLPAQAGISD